MSPTTGAPRIPRRRLRARRRSAGRASGRRSRPSRRRRRAPHRRAGRCHPNPRRRWPRGRPAGTAAAHPFRLRFRSLVLRIRAASASPRAADSKRAGMLLARGARANCSRPLMAPARSVEGESVALARAAHAAGTRVAFGIPGGGANLTLIQACADAGIAFVLVRSESAAVLAAAAYADVADAPGLAVCTRGPGLAAATLGSASALLDRQPVVVATDGTGAAHPHQRLDHARLGATVSKGVAVDGAAAVELALREPRGSVIFDLGGERSSPAAGRRDESDQPATAIRVPGQRPAMIAGIGARRCADALRRVVARPEHPGPDDVPRQGRRARLMAERRGPLHRIPARGAATRRRGRHRHRRPRSGRAAAGEWGWDAPVVALCDILPADRAQVPDGETVVGPLDRLLDRLVLDDGGWPTPAVVLAVGNARRDRRAGRRSRAAGRRASRQVGTAAGDDRDDRRRRAHARGDAVLGCRGAARVSDLERSGDDGLRAARRDRRQLRTRGAGGLLHRRRRSRHVRGRARDARTHPARTCAWSCSTTRPSR